MGWSEFPSLADLLIPLKHTSPNPGDVSRIESWSRSVFPIYRSSTFSSKVNKRTREVTWPTKNGECLVEVVGCIVSHRWTTQTMRLANLVSCSRINLCEFGASFSVEENENERWKCTKWTFGKMPSKCTLKRAGTFSCHRVQISVATPPICAPVRISPKKMHASRFLNREFYPMQFSACLTFIMSFLKMFLSGENKYSEKTNYISCDVASFSSCWHTM